MRGRNDFEDRILFCIKSEYNPELIAKIIDAYKNYYPVTTPPGKGQMNDALRPPAPCPPARSGVHVDQFSKNRDAP